MERDLYELMEWPQIEALEYKECLEPHQILGCHKTKQKILCTAFYPQADKVVVVWGENKHYDMVKVDEQGFFAVLIPAKQMKSYIFEVTDKDKKTRSICDPYSFLLTMNAKGLKGSPLYEKMGSHAFVYQDTPGVLFTVWAPNARGISVVGDFNEWDGCCHQMSKNEDTGIFELFIPGLDEGCLYKYDICGYHGNHLLKADPYSLAYEEKPNGASMVYDPSTYLWKDSQWMENRKAGKSQAPLLIYEMEISGFGKDKSYDEVAQEVVDHCVTAGYTHVQLLPLMEYEDDATAGFETLSYFAPTSRYGTPKQLMKFIDILHQNKLGVIMSWIPAYFSNKESGLSAFDGTHLYEHDDVRQHSYPYADASLFNFSYTKITDFLSAVAWYWAKQYHIDGINYCQLPALLYLDYGKREGDWVANIYGGNQNLDAVEWVKQLNDNMHKSFPHMLMIAQDDSYWPMVTEPVAASGLGFDYKTDTSFISDLIRYMQISPECRFEHHEVLSLGMVYRYSEQFILPLSYKELLATGGCLYEKMPGTAQEKLSNLRVMYAYMMAYPEKKLFFMGEDLGSLKLWQMGEELEWDNERIKINAQFQTYVKALGDFYHEHAAMYEQDEDVAGFEWLSTLDASHSILTLMRKNKKEELLFVFNFSNTNQEKYKVGVPKPGKYKEIFSSNLETYGGEGLRNPRVKQSKDKTWDGRKALIEINAPSLSVSVFRYVQ